MNEPQEWKEAAAKKRDMRTLKSGEAGVRKNGGGHKGKREGGVELAAGRDAGTVGGGGEEEEKEEEGGRGGSLTSARLEPQWLARIQPHSAFDEGWILKLNQSHMSPTERETERPERLRGRQRGW